MNLWIFAFLVISISLFGTEPKVVSIDKIQIRGREGAKLVYIPNTEIPFTGKAVSSYSNSQKKEERSYEEGRLHGTSSVWYQNGQKRWEVSWKDGKKHGVATTWYEDGLKREEANWKNGHMDGLWTIWSKAGNIEISGGFKKGKESGLWTYWSESGEKEGEEYYKDGNLEKELKIRYHLNGKIKRKENWKDGRKNGPFADWYENGQKKTELNFKEGKLHGSLALATWYENGQKEREASLTNGKLDGLAVMWFRNGQKKWAGKSNDGKSEGLWQEWYENGQKRREATFKNGKLISTIIWKPTGEKCFLSKVTGGNGIEVLYDESGKEDIRITYKDGERIEKKSNGVTPFVAPHGGKLVEIGEHGLGIHLELLLNDQGFLQIFVLDAHAENFVSIAQPTIEFLGTDSTGAKKIFHCDAVADHVTGSTVGDTAQFTSREKFSGELPLKGNISSLKVLGKTYKMIAFEFPDNSASLRVAKGSTYYLFASEIELYPTNLQNDLWKDRKNGPKIKYKILWQGNQVFESEVKRGALIADWTGLVLDLEWTDLMGKSISLDEAIKAAKIRYEKGGVVKIVVGQDDLTEDDDHGQLTVSLDALKIGENVIQLKKTSTNAMRRINLRVLPYGSSLKDLIELMR